MGGCQCGTLSYMGLEYLGSIVEIFEAGSGGEESTGCRKSNVGDTIHKGILDKSSPGLDSTIVPKNLRRLSNKDNTGTRNVEVTIAETKPGPGRLLRSAAHT